MALALVAAPYAWAQDKQAPTPAKAPPRVPFTAFRTKPILDFKTEEAQKQGSSLIVQDTPDKKKKTPARRVQIREADSPAALVKIRPIEKPVLDARDIATPPKRVQEDILFSPRIDAPLVAASQPLRIIKGGIPIPPRKPGMMSTNDSGNFDIIERVLAEPADPAPRPPVPQPEVTELPVTPPVPNQTVNIIRLPESKPIVSSVRIRDGNRFSAHSRMSGSLGGGDTDTAGTKTAAVTSTRSIRSLGLPDDMQDLRLGPLKQGKGVSPVLMPGQKVTMAAPDDKRVDSRGIPNEVIVFFQENSSDLEVGQMDIVTNDAINVLKSRSELSLEIIGYAEPQQGGSDATKRLALARALIIQKHLTKAGISLSRLTVEAKGDKTPIEPRDRVEMFFDR